MTTDQHRDLGQRLQAIQHQITMTHRDLETAYGPGELPATMAARAADAIHALRSQLDFRLCREHAGKASREIYGVSKATT